MSTKLTPMMKQYFDVKNNYPDALLFYRLGDFYECFFDDAKIVSLECDLVLTARSAGEDTKAPMCGVPHHAVTPYIQKLINKGYKVAIVEQMEDPATAKGIVRRDVVRIVTPGTVMEELSDDKTSVLIASIEDAQYGFSLILCEMASGKLIGKWIAHSKSELIQVCLKYNVQEIVVNQQFNPIIMNRLRELPNITISYCDETTIDEFYLPLIRQLPDKFHMAFGRLVNYLLSTQFRMLTHLQPVEVDDLGTYCEMDYSTMSNLELVKPLRTNGKNLTLWGYLDQTKTAMGSRTLKSWVQRPLLKETDILQRQDQIAFLIKKYLIRDDITQHLKQIYDLERIVAKIAFKSAQPQDMIRLSRSLTPIPAIKELLKDIEVFGLWQTMDDCSEFSAMLQENLQEEAPGNAKEGSIFKSGVNSTLDELRDIANHGHRWLLDFESKEKERTQIKNLKIGYNRVFGYYIEVSKSNMSSVKEEFGYIRKQTLANAERYITQELKQKEDELLHAKERANRLEEELFHQLIEETQAYLPKIQWIAKAISELDAITSLAQVSSQHGFNRPTFTQDRKISIQESVHPVLQAANKGKQIVSNSIVMDEDEDIHILTGPNMGGKSTYMRQLALIVILAQMGCYVPAKKAQLPVFDRIFTRMGASDDILGGQSTFMMEMSEANTALKHATENSLILFDEIGRGTSTYDGMAIAQAIIEYVATVIKAKTVFSTHYHELTAMADILENVSNIFVQVHEKDDDITFLYRVKRGKADKSYGIHVAQLAKMPESLTKRSKELLNQLESKRRVVQQTMDIVEVIKIPKDLEEIEQMLSSITIEQMTPLQAMQCLADLKDKLKKR